MLSTVVTASEAICSVVAAAEAAAAAVQGRMDGVAIQINGSRPVILVDLL